MRCSYVFFFRCRLLLVLALPLLAAPPLVAQEPDIIIVLANADVPESVELAEFYAEARGIPKAQIVALPMRPVEKIWLKQYVEQIYNPLLDIALEQGWIDGYREREPDFIGRRAPVVLNHRIRYIVVCKGVPLGFGNDKNSAAKDPVFSQVPEAIAQTGASIDAELSVLTWEHSPVVGYLKNPYHGLYPVDSLNELTRWQVIRVCRLDGATYADAKRLVTDAIAVEKEGGLQGEAIVDWGSRHEMGDKWLVNAMEHFKSAGIRIDEFGKGERVREQDSLKGVAWYLGWYSSQVDGPFALPGQHFEQGAVAMHIYSYSAASLEKGTGWAAQLIARGATATVGNTGEPYLALTHRPDLMVDGLLRGMEWGEAAYFALPILSWKPTSIGDPLYRPVPPQMAAQYRAKLEAQMSEIEEQEPEKRPSSRSR